MIKIGENCLVFITKEKFENSKYQRHSHGEDLGFFKRSGFIVAQGKEREVGDVDRKSGEGLLIKAIYIQNKLTKILS